MTGKNWYHAAGRVWTFLISAAQQHSIVTYERVAPVIPTNPLSVRKALGPIQDYCLGNHLPPLTAIVVNKNTRVPGEGFIAWSTDDLALAHKSVFEFNWSKVLNPYGDFDPTDTLDSLSEKLVENPNSSADVYAKVKVRGIAQEIFRGALLKAYDSQCAMCGFSLPSALDAAHIIPWSVATSAQKLDPRNGLLLCSLHHRLFDSGLITLSKSRKVVFYDSTMESILNSVSDKQMTIDLHGRNAYLPTNDSLCPSIEYLKHHHEQHELG